MRKRPLLPLLALVFALLLTSCVGQRPGDGHITLTVMGKRSDVEKPYMTRIFERYEAATGNRIKLIAPEDSEFETEAVRLFGEGKGPDVLMHFYNADLNRFDVAADFRYLNDQEWVDDLTDSARAYCTDGDGDLLGLPFWESSVSGCYYNKTLLDSLGLKAAATQAEFDTLCQALTEIGYTPVCWPADGCAWMAQFGLDPIFADDPDLLERLNSGEVRYADIPAVTNMVEWIANAAKRGWFGPDYLETGWSEISPALADGRAVMTFIWDTWFYTDLEQGGKYTVDDFALMPVFMDTVEGGTYEGGNLNMMMVNRNGDQVDQEWGPGGRRPGLPGFLRPAGELQRRL